MLGAIGCEIEFLVEPTTEKEWPWIMQCLLEISISTLTPDLKETDENIVNVQLAEEVENICGTKGIPEPDFHRQRPGGQKTWFLVGGQDSRELYWAATGICPGRLC